jgi:hypothetical protein
MNRDDAGTLEEAAELFRENETMFGDSKQDKEKANLYRGLAALADALAELSPTARRANHETSPATRHRKSPRRTKA